MLGEREKDMVHLGLLATAPAAQGRGYGTQLIKSITDIVSVYSIPITCRMFNSRQADAEGRATHLTSSNMKNVPFYESLGFKIVGEILLGDDDPTHDGPPIHVPLVCNVPTESSALC